MPAYSQTSCNLRCAVTLAEHNGSALAPPFHFMMISFRWHPAFIACRRILSLYYTRINKHDVKRGEWSKLLNVFMRYACILCLVIGFAFGIGGSRILLVLKQKDQVVANNKSSWLKSTSYDMPAILDGLTKVGLDKSIPDKDGIEYLVKKGALPEIADIWFCPSYMHVVIEGGISIDKSFDSVNPDRGNSEPMLATRFSRSPYYLERKNGRIYVKSRANPSIEDFFVEDK